MIRVIPPAEIAREIARKARSHLHALVALYAIEFVLIAATLVTQRAFCPMAYLDAAMFSYQFILLLLHEELQFRGDWFWILMQCNNFACHAFKEARKVYKSSSHGKRMDIQDALLAIESDKKFAKWRAKNKAAYLSHAFKMFQDEHKEWQLGFYDRKTEKITTFMVSPGKVELRPAEEVFKKDEHINKLELPTTLLPLKDIMTLTTEYQQRHYPKDRSVKTIALLQSLPEYGSVWNITLVTQAFNTLNMKLHPATGEILDHKLSSIFSFRQTA
jgi:hypothetical protein